MNVSSNAYHGYEYYLHKLSMMVKMSVTVAAICLALQLGAIVVLAQYMIEKSYRDAALVWPVAKLAESFFMSQLKLPIGEKTFTAQEIAALSLQDVYITNMMHSQKLFCS